MGLRDKLKQKLEKHGGPAGLVVAALKKPVNMASGGAGTRAADPLGSRARDALPPPKDGWVAVAVSGEIAPGRPKQVEVHGTTIAVFRADKVYAIDNACLHEDGPLGEATQDGHVIACPYHDWRYDLRDGTCLTYPERRIGCWAAREEGGFVWVGKALSTSTRDRGGEHDDGLVTV